MIVRKAVEADVETIAGFQVTMARESEEMDLDRETVRKGVGAVVADPAKGAYYVVEDNGSLLGCMLTVPEWSDWRNGTVIWIHSLFVVPEARRKGVFRALYADLQERVRTSPDLMGIRLYVDKRNTKAQAAYEALEMNDDHYHLYEWMK